MTVPKTHTLRQQLRQAVFDCRERGLTEAATWAAQQLIGLPKPSENDLPTEPSSSDNAESDVFMYAKSLFDSKVRSDMALATDQRLRSSDWSDPRTCDVVT
jgi:Anaphase promoting complex subunit 8 / Cdc23